MKPKIADPSIRIICGNRSISLIRKAGGEPLFQLITHKSFEAVAIEWRPIVNENSFNKLWDFLMSGHKDPPEEKTGKCANCGEIKVLVTTDGLCQSCLDRYEQGIG